MLGNDGRELLLGNDGRELLLGNDGRAVESLFVFLGNECKNVGISMLVDSCLIFSTQFRVLSAVRVTLVENYEASRYRHEEVSCQIRTARRKVDYTTILNGRAAFVSVKL